ncbi:fasciclin domain-containing protein [Sphingobacterium bovisgrunnientis]|jgi:uncharacterized surface protein with fasciclin (FAS1) repeats|uniref:fasciclin domain-containing protein n=1 Tax=Sphingobacterium bovisgrunnientis TaxID=1874697 RepID=UPI0013580E1A|nr:fasciclin domain-containing protein [Sphingobacterium bovisgrunnientis]
MERIRNNIRSFHFVLLLLNIIFFFSCKDAYEDKTYMAFEEKPIALLLQEDPDNKYSMWIDVLRKAELFSTLNLNTTYTFFAPINSGVEKYLAKLNITSVDQLSKEDANYLVKYHLIPNVKVDLAQFQSGAIDNLTSTNDNLFIDFREGGLESIYLNGVSRFNRFDIQATNGIIHSIDEVLEPLTASIFKKLSDSRYSIFEQAVKATGLDQVLDQIYVEAVDEFGKPYQQRFRYTTFVVPNEVYLQQGIRSFEDLVQKVGSTVGADYKEQNNPVYKYTAYHILPMMKSYSDLGKFPTGTTTMNMETLATNELMQISEGNASLIINPDATTSQHINIIKTNIIAKNGVLHEVDNWMPVFVPERVMVIWEFTNNPEVAANVTSFQNGSLGSQYNKTFSANELSSIVWQSVPETKSDVLIYRNARSADGIYYSGVRNYDHFRVTLGESGWIQMQTPTIIKGKYRLTYVWPSPRATSNTGICSFIIDNQEIHPRLVISNTSADAKRTQVIGTVDFPETTSHTFRVLSLDGKLITMDYLQFDPID